MATGTSSALHNSEDSERIAHSMHKPCQQRRQRLRRTGGSLEAFWHFSAVEDGWSDSDLCRCGLHCQTVAGQPLSTAYRTVTIALTTLRQPSGGLALDRSRKWSLFPARASTKASTCEALCLDAEAERESRAFLQLSPLSFSRTLPFIHPVSHPRIASSSSFPIVPFCAVLVRIASRSSTRSVRSDLAVEHTPPLSLYPLNAYYGLFQASHSSLNLHLDDASHVISQGCSALCVHRSRPAAPAG